MGNKNICILNPDCMGIPKSRHRIESELNKWGLKRSMKSSSMDPNSLSDSLLRLRDITADYYNQNMRLLSDLPMNPIFFGFHRGGNSQHGGVWKPSVQHHVGLSQQLGRIFDRGYNILQTHGVTLDPGSIAEYTKQKKALDESFEKIEVLNNILENYIDLIASGLPA